MKRSNRLVLLVGVFLAIVAFVGILLLSNGTTQPPVDVVPTTGSVVVATTDIPLSTKIRADQVTTKTVALAAISPGAFADTSQVIGRLVRHAIAKDAQLNATDFGVNSSGTVTQIETPAGLRAMAVQVDQITGVGTVIQPGDYVDMVIGLTGDKFPVITVSPVDESITVVAGLNNTSVKLVIQGIQVLGTLLPPAAAPAEAPAPTDGSAGTPTTPNTTLNGQQQIVILAVTAQQTEVIKFAQFDASISLVLRSPDDFIDPITGEPLIPAQATTTGVILRTVVDAYGVLPPEVVQTVTPSVKGTKP